MTYLWILFIVLHVVSIGFTLLSLQRLFYYIKRYRFSESKYTLLFGFMHLHWIMMGYLALAALWIVASYLIFTLI